MSNKLTLHFYLKSESSKNDTEQESPVLIYLHASYSGERLKQSTGQKVKPSKWNKKQERVYAGATDADKVNKELTKLKKIAQEEYDTFIEQHKNFPTTEQLKDLIKEKLTGVSVKPSESIFDVFDLFIEECIVKKAVGTVKKFKGIKAHLIAYGKISKQKISFATLDDTMLDKMVDKYFIEHLEQQNSTIKEKHLKSIKTFLTWAVGKGYSSYTDYKKYKFPYKVELADNIALTQDELNVFVALDLSENKKLEAVRDLLCLECYTGLRYEGIRSLLPANVKETHIDTFSDKVSSPVYIPLIVESRKLLDKYIGHPDFLPVISNQKMNRYLKELGELAGLTGEEVIIKMSGKTITRIVKKRYQMLTTHTGRRTFVTLSREKGMDVEMIMAITAHKDYDMFKRYYKINQIKVKSAILRAWNPVTEKLNDQTKYEIARKLMEKNVSTEIILYATGIDTNTWIHPSEK